ncbi:MAG: hypothetical protein KAI47_02035, partial [Deltaproteobacteria bacterium]|nr:hypothetical protein [Deltaproteobacteria bacterium]
VQPASADLRALVSAGSSSPRPRSSGVRPEQRASRIAHLVSLIDGAVVAGHLLKPPRKNALAYLWRLKKLDPSGKGTAQVQKLMADTLRKRAEALWGATAQRGEAAQIYARIARLDPEDAVAKRRAEGVSPTRAVIIKAGSGSSSAPKLSTDAARARVLVAEGNKLLAAGQEGAAAAAAKKFEAARRAAPNSIAAVVGLARAKFEQNVPIAALRWATKATRLNPKSIVALLIVGDANYQLGRIAGARGAWERVLALSPNHRAAQKRLARLSK